MTTWNPSDKGPDVTLSNGNLTTSIPGLYQEAVRATSAKTSGKWYWTVTLADANSLSGLGNASAVITNVSGSFGSTSNGVGYFPGNGNIIKNNAAVANVATAGLNDVIGFAWDVDGGSLAFYKNGVLLTTISGANLPAGTLFPITGQVSGGATRVTANFGATAFAFAAPTGFTAYDAPVSAATLQNITAASVGSSNALTSAVSLQNITAVSAAIVSGAGSVQPLQAIAATSAGATAINGTSSASLKALTAVSAGNSTVIPTLQAITAAGTAVTGTISVSASATLQGITASGVAGAGAISQATPELITAVGTALVGTVGTSSATLEFIAPAGTGTFITAGTSAVSLRPLSAVSAAYSATGSTFSAVVMHTETNALWQYTNFNFNSFARFNGTTLAGGDAGLFTLGGGDDNGVKISAQATLGITDFNSAHEKRVDRVYLGYRSTGEMILRVTIDETKTRDYRVPAALPANGGLHGRHIKLGRGVEARYWQFSVLNKDGSDFSLNMLECKPTELRRRVGGGLDA